MEVIQKGKGPQEFSFAQRFLIDHPVFQAQTDDLVEALHFLAQFYDEARYYPVELIDGSGPSTRELPWRSMLERLHFPEKIELH